jgi:hypothetical protein
MEPNVIRFGLGNFESDIDPPFVAKKQTMMFQVPTKFNYFY